MINVYGPAASLGSGTGGDMKSAEFYQVFGRARHEELLEEARQLRGYRVAAGQTRGLVRAVSFVGGYFAALAGASRHSSRRGWVGGSVAGKPIHG
jgi:hypothetical protein